MGGCASKNCCVCCFGHIRPYRWYNEPYAQEHGKRPSRFPCAATALYWLLPSEHDEEALTRDAKILRDAMAGIGTDEANLIRILTTRTASQMRAIKRIFEKEFGNGQTLEQWIESDTSGDFEKVLLACVREQAETDAELVHDSMDGLGTDDEVLRYVITTRTNAQLVNMAVEYEKKYHKPLVQDLAGDTSMSYRKALQSIIHKAEYLAERLHDAVTRPGTDDDRIMRIITHVPRSNRILRNIVAKYDDPLNSGVIPELDAEASMPDLQDVKAAYQKKFGRSLEADVAADTSGNYKATLLLLLADPAETTAKDFHTCIESARALDNWLIEMTATRSNASLLEAVDAYQKKYGKELSAAIDGINGTADYKDTLQMLLKPRALNTAEALYEAYDGVGTDDDTTIAALTKRSRQEIKEIALAFEKKFGKPLEAATKAETSFWYKRTLVYILRQATENLMHVDERYLLRVRDV